MSQKEVSGEATTSSSATGPSQSDYESLSEFRYLLRRFLEFSQSAARAVGLTAQQHQALLAIKGSPPHQLMVIGDLAERLQIRHHSAAELVNRLSDAGLIVRDHDINDRRRVVVSLTAKAERLLVDLSSAHLDELRRVGPMLENMLSLIRRDEPPI